VTLPNHSSQDDAPPMPLRKRGATIEGRKSIPQSRPRRQIPKRHRGHQNAGSTMPPDRSRHPISRISSADVAAVSKQVHLALFYDCNLDIGAMD